jgi:hypothetical protein
MEPFRKYQKTNEDNLQATASRLTQQHSGSEGFADASRPLQAIVQIPAENLSDDTREFLGKISELDNYWDIIELIKNQYNGDGTDFNLYYKAIAAKIKDSKIHNTSFIYNISVADLVIGSVNARKMENGMQKTPEYIINNAYYSLAMDVSVEAKDRLGFALAITDTAKKMAGLRSVLKVLQTNTKEERKIYIHILNQLFGIAQELENNFETLRLRSIADNAARQIFERDSIDDDSSSLLSLVGHLLASSEKLSYYYRIAQSQGTSLHFFLEAITLAKKTLKSIPYTAEAKNAPEQIDSLCFDRFLEPSIEDFLKNIPNNEMILGHISTPDKKHKFLIEQASKTNFTLLYRLHLGLFTDCKETLKAIYTKIVEDPFVDLEAIDEALLYIADVPELDKNLWDESLAAIAQDANLSLTARLNAAAFVIRHEDLRDLIESLQVDATINQEKAYYAFLLEKGYELFVHTFIMQDPDVVCLEAFNAFYMQQISCIEATKEFYNGIEAKITKELEEAEEGDHSHIEDLNLQKDENARRRQWVLERESIIQQTYPLYKIVLEKSEQPYTIQDATAELGLDQEEHLNENAYALPPALDPVWRDNFADFDFDFFMDKIKTLKDVCVDLAQNRQAKQEDIDLYTNMHQGWLAILQKPEYCAIKDLLNITSKTENTHVLKLKTIVFEIERGIQLSRHEDVFAALNSLILNSATCYGGQLQAIENTYFTIVSNNDRVSNSQRELAEATVLNCLYTIRLNWVLENIVEYIEDGKYVHYTPIDEDGLFIADGPFMDELEQFLNKEQLMDAFSCDAAALEQYTFLTNRDAYADAYGRTHIGLDILGIAGIELGLRTAESGPPYDLNIEADSWFLKNSASDKVNILKAFVKSFTFENIWQGLADLLWQKTAESSKLEIDLYADKDCVQAIRLEDGVFMSKEDPLAKGPCKFLKALALKPEDCCKQRAFYYELDDQSAPDEVQINTEFSKEGIRAILAELKILS